MVPVHTLLFLKNLEFHQFQEALHMDQQQSSHVCLSKQVKSYTNW